MVSRRERELRALTEDLTKSGSAHAFQRFTGTSLSVCVCLSLTRTVTVPWARVQREEGILSCGNTGGRSSGPGHVYSSNGTMTYPTVNTARTRQQDNSAAYPSPGGGWAPRHQASRGYMCPHPSLFRGCHVQRDSRGIQCLTVGT